MSNIPDSELSIEDIAGPRLTLECGAGGGLVFPQNIEFKAPPPRSPNAGRLVLATAKTGSILVDIKLKEHRVFLNIVKGGDERDLLIRIPIGVRIFEVRAVGGFFLYYETMDGYNVIPLYIANGTDSGQTMQELVLAVSPVPPRDPMQATERLTFPHLTVHELNIRRLQNGLPPLTG
jgi:hypothetical protein